MDLIWTDSCIMRFYSRVCQWVICNTDSHQYSTTRIPSSDLTGHHSRQTDGLFSGWGLTPYADDAQKFFGPPQSQIRSYGLGSTLYGYEKYRCPFLPKIVSTFSLNLYFVAKCFLMYVVYLVWKSPVHIKSLFAMYIIGLYAFDP